MAHPRFVCTTTRTFTAVSPTEAGTPSQPPLWRLVGGNNRELGRAQVPAEPDDVCCAAVRRLLQGLDRATPKIKSAGPHGASSWTWSLELDQVTLAVSGRSYLRQRECQYSLAHFIEAAPNAVFSGEHCRVLEGAGQ